MDQWVPLVDLNQKITQGVSTIPVVVSLLVLLSGGALGAWFAVEENIFYFAYDETNGFLDGEAEYNYYLDLVAVSEVAGEYNIEYSANDCNCDERADVFFNIKVIFYAVFFSSVLAAGMVAARNFDLIKGISKQDLAKYSFTLHVLVIILVLFLGLYVVMGVPSAMNSDFSGTPKECLYGSDITIIGKSSCYVDTVNDEAELVSSWRIGFAPIIILIGVMIPNVYLASEVLEQISVLSTSESFEPELYFDPDDKLLFDVNTGEVIRSFVKDKRALFFDTEAKVLFDEKSGDIVYSSYFDKFISEKVKTDK